MRKTRAKNRKRNTLTKIRPKLYSKRKGRGIGSSKLENTTLDTAFSNNGFSISCYNDQREAKQEYKKHLKLALAINKDHLALLDKGLTNLKNAKRNASRNIRGNASQTAEYTKDRKYAEFAKNYNIMLLKRFASQQSIDYDGLLRDFNENPDFEILRMAPSYDKWARESA
jgi:hypothetical protein